MRRQAPLWTRRIAHRLGLELLQWGGIGHQLSAEAEVLLVLVDDPAADRRPGVRLRDVALDHPLEPGRDALEPELVIVVQPRAVLVQVRQHPAPRPQLDGYRDGFDVVRDRHIESAAAQVFA